MRSNGLPATTDESSFGSVLISFSDVTLPGAGGPFEILRDAGDLVVRVSGGAELLRQSAETIYVLRLTGTADADFVTVLNTGTVVDTPLVFFGSDGNGRFDASLATSNVNLTGNGGDDLLIGGSGDDTLNGGDGNDTVYAGNGRDSVSGGNGNDRLFGNNGYDTISGGLGNDFLRGGRGRDSLTGDAGDDELLGDDHNDTLIGGSDRADGEAGADTIDVQEAPQPDGIDSVVGGDMADTTLWIRPIRPI